MIIRKPLPSCLYIRASRCSRSPLSATATRNFHPAYVEAGEMKDLSFLESYKQSFGVPRPNLGLSSKVEEENPKLHKIGDQVTVHGYLGKRRDVSEGFCFVPLSGRGAYKKAAVQLISRKASNAELHSKLKKIRYNSAVSVTGILQHKRLEKGKTSQSTKEGYSPQEELEIVVSDVTCLNAFPEDIILSEDAQFGSEQRHMQLMDEDLSLRLQLRSKFTLKLRNTLESQDFQEVETPILFKSTPEGAREFLVPTRRAGFAYALPQSPQQYKQILMASGINRYFQFAKCFRDEDLRADRQPEFTQLDLEMSFADGEQIMHEVENLVNSLFTYAGLRVPSPIPRMTYQTAMNRFGSDKPDVRIQYEIQCIDHLVPESLKRMLTDLPDPIFEVLKFPISEDPASTRNFVNSFMDSSDSSPFQQNPDGAPGIFIYDSRKPLQGLQAFGFEGAAKLEEFFESKANAGVVADAVVDSSNGSSSTTPLQDGDLLVVQARHNTVHQGGSTSLGRLRLALHAAAVAANYLPSLPQTHEFLWITDFPLFTPDSTSSPGSGENKGTGEGQGGRSGFSATHHPFTAPKSSKDVDLLLTDPLSAKADHYDLVVNGVELGGGSRRIHSSEMQKFIMRDILKIPGERLADFSHLFEVLRSGCPPHAGFALGFDRLVAVMLWRESIRDVIAFPKNGRGEDVLVGSPSVMTEEQLKTYGLDLRNEKIAGGK